MVKLFQKFVRIRQAKPYFSTKKVRPASAQRVLQKKYFSALDLKIEVPSNI